MNTWENNHINIDHIDHINNKKITSVLVIITPTAVSLKNIWCLFIHVYVYSESSSHMTHYSMNSTI